MAADHGDTEDLMRRAGDGDPAATEELLARYRDRLRQMIAVRMDPRVAARVDASDIVQEILVEACRRLAYYRLGRYEKAIRTLQEAIERLGGGVGASEELFFLAMAEWQRGDRDQARRLYDEGVDWMAQNESLAIWTDQLITYRYEAAQLMGIPGAPRPAEKDLPAENRESHVGGGF